MSRLDYFTIAVVAVCIIAIIFLLYKTSDLIGGKSETQTELQKTLKEMGIEEDMEDTDTLNYDSTESDDMAATSEPSTDRTTQPAAAKSSSKPATTTTPKTTDAAPKTTAKTTTAQPAAKTAEKPAQATASGDYLVVAGSFKVLENAENEAKRLRKMGYPNASVGKSNNGTFATLIVDRFSNEKDAAKLVEDLKTKNIIAYVHRKRTGEN